jgi:hypothetical protein
MTGRVTLRQVEELVAALPLPDQQRLIERMAQRLNARRDDMARAEAFLKACLESPVRPAAEMDAGEEIAAMREERGDDLL